MTEKQQPLGEEDIERLLKKVGPREEPSAEMAARVRANVHAAWQEQVAEQATREHEVSGDRSWFRMVAGMAAVTCAVYVGFTLQQDPVTEAVIASLDTGTSSVMVSSDGLSWQSADRTTFEAGTYLRAEDRVSMTLASQMNIRLDHGAEVRLDGPGGVHLVTGSMYADSYERVTPGDFQVSTRFGTATDIGTQFLVTSSESGWSVQVREGEVHLVDGGHARRLQPGVRIEIAQNDEAVESAIPADHDSWAWTESVRPGFDIDGRPVDDYLRWVARETGRELRYASPAARATATESRLSGTIANMTATDSLQQVLPATDLRLITTDDGVIMVESSLAE